MEDNNNILVSIPKCGRCKPFMDAVGCYLGRLSSGLIDRMATDELRAALHYARLFNAWEMTTQLATERIACANCASSFVSNRSH